MKKLLFFVLPFLAGSMAMAQNEKGEPYIVKTFPAASVKNVEASTSGGFIEVSGTAGSEARLEVFIRNNSSNGDLSREEIQNRLNEYYDLQLELDGHTMIAKSKTKKNNMDWKKGLSISFRITVSRETATKLTTSGGNISISSLQGDQDFTTSGGNLNVDQVSGKVKGVTSGGNITVSGSSDRLELVTSGGNIKADNCKGKIKLATSGGSLTIDNLDGDIEAATSGGNVNGNNIRGELRAGTSGGNVDLKEIYGSLSAGTSGGSINVSVRELGKYLKLGNSGGSINLELPANKGLTLDIKGSRIKTGTLNNFSGKVDDERINGSLNGGGIPVTIDAGSGRVNITWK